MKIFDSIDLINITDSTVGLDLLEKLLLELATEVIKPVVDKSVFNQTLNINLDIIDGLYIRNMELLKN